MNLIKFTQSFLMLFAAALLFSSVTVSPSFADDDDDRLKIVVLGDSLVAGYQLPDTDGFVPKLQAVFDARSLNAKLIAAGVSGDTSSGGLSRLDWSVPDNADGVILELGANDALRGLPPEKTKENLQAIITSLKDKGIKVFLIGMLAPPNMGEDYAIAFNPLYADLAKENELPLYPFFLDGVMAVEGMTLADAMHPNTRGVEVMVGKVLPQIEKWLEDLQPIP